MRIYYFGNLIQADDSKRMSYSELMKKIGEVEFFASSKIKTVKEKTEELQQTQLKLESPVPVKKSGMQSIGELLQEIDMNLDVYRSKNRQRGSYA